MPLTIRGMGHVWVIDDGIQILHECPCCSNPFTSEKAAQSTVKEIERGTVSFDVACRIEAYSREIRNRLRGEGNATKEDPPDNH